MSPGRRRALAVLAAWPLWAPSVVRAQPSSHAARIGYLHIHSIEAKPTPERAAFLAGLRKLGYEPGRNLVIEYRGAAGQAERLPELARELVETRVELIVTASTEATVAAKAATDTIPIVAAIASDPVYAGLARSYARPGGNVTGLSFIAPELGAKRMELLRELLPQARRVVVIWNSRNPISNHEWSQARDAAGELKMQVDASPIKGADDLASTLDGLHATRPDAILVIVDPRMVRFRKIIADAALKERIPCVAGWRGYVESGALASYAPDFKALFHRAADYVDRLLKGAKPQDLPIERPTKFELAVNLRTAAAIGVAVPRTLLLRADAIIQ